ncbi:MAG: quinone oxidoreductase family protein [Rhodospirillaceae bacterium]
MTKAIVVRTTGGPEVLRLENITVGDPGPGELKLRQSAAGVNFIDTYFRTGLYKAAPAPGFPAGVFIPGQEGVGTVEAVGAGVTDIKVGERVAYGNGPAGGYAEHRLIPAASVVKVPAGIKDEQVAGMMLRGLTVWYLIRALHVVQPGETVLFHAAAGGVGLIFCQWAKHLGATVIGTVGSAEKAKIAKAAGCDHTILYKQEDWVAKVKELTGGKGVPVVYDGVGKDTFAGSLDCLARRGLMCSFGNASGPAPAIEPAVLSAKGSLFLTRPRLGDYIFQREDHVRAADELFDVVAKGAVKVDIGQSYTLDQAAHAHSDLESRKTTGSTILVI